MSTVPIGTPITTEQAARAILRLLNTPLLRSIDVEANSPGTTVSILHQPVEEGGPALYDMLSGGEKHLVDMAAEIWTNQGMHRALGGVDIENRRRVILILAYLHLGHDLPLDGFGQQEHEELFGG